jgi:NADPH2:quinone reductase
MQRRLTITGSTLRPRPVAFKQEIKAQLLQHIWPRLADGRLRPVVDRVFPLEQAGQAHAYMESGQQIGKIVLSVA